MEPMHRAPGRREGIMLGEKMVTPTEIAKAIRVVDPPFFRGWMDKGLDDFHSNIPINKAPRG